MQTVPILRLLFLRPMSLMYSKNISGPRTVPCGTPDVTITGEDRVPLTTTV